MTEKIKFPISCTSGVILQEMKDGEGYTAIVRIPLDASSYLEHFLAAPTQSAMMQLISTIRNTRQK